MRFHFPWNSVRPVILAFACLFGAVAATLAADGLPSEPGTRGDDQPGPNPADDLAPGGPDSGSGHEGDGDPIDIDYVIEQIRNVIDLLGRGWH